MKHSDSRQGILNHIQSSLLSHAPASSNPYPAHRRPAIEEIGSEKSAERFVEMLEKVGGEGHILDSREAAVSILRGIIGRAHGQKVLVPPVAELEGLDVPRLLQEAQATLLRPAEVAQSEAAEAALGITTAQAGIADTGTVVLWHDTSEGRLAALLAPVHVVLLRRPRIYPDKITYLAACMQDGLDLGATPMTWVTGPSLTADIEKVLVRGAHGPRQVIVLIF